MRQGNGTPTIDWQRRHGPASVSTSPARSTLSLSSTVNLYQAALPLSATTTPGNIPPPSPLYYDYTEDFDIDDYNQPEVLDPPPQFRIEKTIPEDRPLSSGWQPNGTPDDFSLKRGFIYNRQPSFSTPSKAQKLPQSSRDSFPDTTGGGKLFEAVDSGDSNTDPVHDTLTENPASESRDKKVIRLSRLGLGAQELNSHVEEAFGLIPSPSFEILIPGDHESRNQRRSSQIPISDGYNSYEADGVDGETELSSARVSSFSLNSHLRQHPPSLDANTLGTVFSSREDTGTVGIGLGDSGTVQSGTVIIDPSQSQDFAVSLPEKRATILPITQRSSSPEDEQDILSHATSNARNIADIDQLLLSLDQSGGNYNNQPQRGAQHTNVKSQPVLSASLSLHKISSGHHMKPRLSSNRQPGKHESRHGLSQQSKEWNNLRIGGRRMEAATIPSYGETDVPNFSHQIPRKLMSRSESPMLAPKPISPARQLKLKNSVPQLMKALPPLPPEQSVRTVTPPLKLSSSEGLPCRFSPLIPVTRSLPADETGEPYTNQCLGQIVVPTLPTKFDLSLLDTALKNPEEGNTTSSPPKLKLKLRSSGALTSSSDGRPQILEENYLFPSHNPHLGLPSIVQDNRTSHPKPPKFKLKITRASNSTLGTVRINRESSSDSKFSTGLHLPSPKDLFTPNIGIDGIFRQVSRHIHSRRESVYSNHVSPPDSPVSSAPDQTTEKYILKPASSDAQTSSASSTGPGSLPDGRSYFSDDSCNIYGLHNIRKRLTNLRARISIPYKSRIGSRSFDDIAWRKRNETLHPPPAATSHLQLPSTGMGVEVRHTRRLTEKLRTQKLRFKVSKWFKGARSAIASRVKPRTGSGRSEEE